MTEKNKSKRDKVIELIDRRLKKSTTKYNEFSYIHYDKQCKQKRLL